MNKTHLYFALILLVFCLGATPVQKDIRFLHYVAEPAQITLYWKGNDGQPLKSLQNLKIFVEEQGKQLAFGMNGGMYKPDNSPQGLFIENNIVHTKLDTLSGTGNFYLKPNGVFYLTNDGSPIICATPDFTYNNQIKFATQSGPMLLIDGEIHPAFKKGSPNLNIRNGVGILPDNRVVFVIAKQEVNFHDFATYFKDLNCKNALYLDGFVSRAYIPDENWKQLDGNFGVMIGVIK